MIDVATAWRPFDPGIVKRFFIADQDGLFWWVGPARDRDHFIELLREQGAEWEYNIQYVSTEMLGIDGALEVEIVEVRELGAEEVARRQRCHTDDERGVIPLAEAAIGDLFCSEW